MKQSRDVVVEWPRIYVVVVLGKSKIICMLVVSKQWSPMHRSVDADAEAAGSNNGKTQEAMMNL